MAMPAVEFANPSELHHFREIKENLQNPANISWILRERQWIKIVKTRNFNNISQLGLAFEDSVDGQNPNSFEIFTFVGWHLVDLLVSKPLTRVRFFDMLLLFPSDPQVARSNPLHPTTLIPIPNLPN